MLATTEILKRHIHHDDPEHIFEVFDFLCLIPALVLVEWCGAGRPGRRRALAFVACMGPVAAAALLVFDIECSLVYLLPGVRAAISFCPLPVTLLRSALLTVLLGNVAWAYPATSIVAIAGQLVRDCLVNAPFPR